MKNTIKSAQEISLMFKEAKRVNTKNVIALIAPTGVVRLDSLTDDERGLCGRVAFIAGKKLGTAPQRSRAKRLMREAARVLEAPWCGADVVFLAKEPILKAHANDVVHDIDTVKKRYLVTSVAQNT